MSSPLQVTIVRAGKEIGTYDLAEVLRLLGAGTLKPTDYYWHEGMTEWASLLKLQASEARRQLAERALQQKEEEEEEEEEAIKAEQLAQEKDKAKEEENRAVAEAVRARHKSEKENRFWCHSCQNDFVYPKKKGGSFWRGIALILCSGLFFFITYSVADIHRPSPSGDFFGNFWLDDPVSLFVGRVRLCLSIGGLVLLLFGLIFSVSNQGYSCCPECGSMKFSRPERTDDQK